MAFRVLLTDDAVRDLEEIRGWIEEAFRGLSGYPDRGRFPRELLDIGIREYREVFFRPYRIIYRVIGETVYVLVVADGRRDMRSLLERRLLRG